jgi:hypothetical protein
VSLQVYTIRSSGGRAPHILNIDIRNGYKVVFKILSPYPQGQSLQDAQHVMLRHGGEEKPLPIAENCTLIVSPWSFNLIIQLPRLDTNKITAVTKYTFAVT